MKQLSALFCLTALVTATVALAQQAPPQTPAGPPASATSRGQGPNATTVASSKSASHKRASQCDNTNTLCVILDKKGTPCIDESGNANQVSHPPIHKTITWQLDSAIDGTIVGIEWVKRQGPNEIHAAPPPDPPLNLDSFKIDGDGQWATMLDRHNSASTGGQYLYDLIIQVGSSTTPTLVYSCTSGATGPNSNGSIKNN